MKTLVLSLLLGISATVASADITTIYNINFSGGSPNPTAGPFTWDSTTDQFTAFSVTFKSTVFNLLSEANSPGAVQGCGTQASTDNVIDGTANRFIRPDDQPRRRMWERDFIRLGGRLHQRILFRRQFIVHHM